MIYENENNLILFNNQGFSLIDFELSFVFKIDTFKYDESKNYY